MRRLAVVSLLLLTGCASVPPQSPHTMAVAVHPPPTIERPWLLPRPADEITLFDTRTLQALRKSDETEALNAVQRPLMWVGVGVGAVYGLFLIDTTEEMAEGALDCFFSVLFGGCGDED
jgi:hypothetical protein